MSLSDNFNRADGDLGANWTDTHSPGCSVATNQAKGDSADDYAGARYSGSVWQNNHSSQALMVEVVAGLTAPAVRMSTGPNWYAWFSHGSVQECIGGGAPAELATNGGFTNGTTDKMSATGTTLEMFIGGVSQGTVTDASLASGAPGLMFYEDAGRIDDWVGTGEGAPAVALTGTVTAAITEADIVTGGKTIILTLTDETYISN